MGKKKSSVQKARAVVSQPQPRNALEETTVGSTGGIRTIPTYQPWQTVRSETPAVARQRVKTSRFLQEKLPFVGYLVKQLPEEALGDGLVGTSQSKNPQFRRDATALFDLWAQSNACDIRSRLNFYSAQSVIGATMCGDGECFGLKVKDTRAEALQWSLRDKSKRAIQFQLFTRDQLGNGNASFEPNSRWNDGILFNELLKPVTYRTLIQDATTLPAAEKFLDRAAAVMMHIFNDENLNQGHGRPWIFPSEESALDALDLKAIKKYAEKIRAAFLGAIKTPTGEAPVSMRQQIKKGVTKNEANETVDNGQRYLELPGGVVFPVFKDTETVSFFNSQETTVGQLIHLLFHEMALGFRMPPEYLWQIATLGSAAARVILRKVAKGLNRIRRPVRDHFCQPMWEMVIGDAMQDKVITDERGNVIKRIPALLPFVDDWNSVLWKPSSPDPSIDAGRDERAEQERLRTFTGTVEEYCDTLGRDGEKTRHARIDEIADNIRYAQTAHNLPWFLAVDPMTLQAIAGIASAMQIDLAAIGEQLKNLPDAMTDKGAKF